MSDIKLLAILKTSLKISRDFCYHCGTGYWPNSSAGYASHDATVILHGRKVEKLESLYNEIEAGGRA